MSITLYEIAVPSFKQHLEALDALIDKTVAHLDAKNIEASALFDARLYPDMYTLKRQVTSACDFAKLSVARLAGVTPPKHGDSERTFADLKTRIADTMAVLNSVTPEQMSGAEDQPFVIKAGPRELHFKGRDYLLHFALPNFYFHCATAYGILRHNGVEIGKRDFMRRLQPAQ